MFLQEIAGFFTLSIKDHCSEDLRESPGLWSAIFYVAVTGLPGQGLPQKNYIQFHPQGGGDASLLSTGKGDSLGIEPCDWCPL